MQQQIDVVNTTYSIGAIITHPAVLTNVLQMAKANGIPDSKIILVKRDTDRINPESHRFATIPDLLEKFANKHRVPRGAKMGPGGAKKKVAALAFSSGTTGLPKSVVVSHYSLIVNIIQAAQFSPGRYKAGVDRTIGASHLTRNSLNRKLTTTKQLSSHFFMSTGSDAVSCSAPLSRGTDNFDTSLIVILHYAIYEGVAVCLHILTPPLNLLTITDPDHSEARLHIQRLPQKYPGPRRDCALERPTYGHINCERSASQELRLVQDSSDVLRCRARIKGVGTRLQQGGSCFEHVWRFCE